MSASAPLAPLSPNKSPSKTTTTSKDTETTKVLKPSMRPSEKEEPKFFKGRMASAMGEDSNSNQMYISPSDTILSPASQKISALKGKRFGGSGAKPQSLFAKTSIRNAVAKSPEGPKQQGFGSLGREVTSAPAPEAPEAAAGEKGA